MDATRSLESLTKEELVTKCTHFLKIAKQAANKKKDLAIDLEKAKAVEDELRATIAKLETNATGDVSNVSEENAHLKLKVEELKSIILEKERQNDAFEKTLESLKNKISDYELQVSEYAEKLKSCEQRLEDVLTEKKFYKEKCNSLEIENRTAHDSYVSLESKLQEFHSKYKIEKEMECKLQACLRKLEEKSEKSSTRSESRDGLPTVNESQEIELELVCQKMDKAYERCQKYKSINAKLLKDIEERDKSLDEANENIKQLKESYNRLVERSLHYCSEFKEKCEKASIQYKELENKYKCLSESTEQRLNSDDLSKVNSGLISNIQDVNEKLFQYDNKYADSQKQYESEINAVKIEKTKLENRGIEGKKLLKISEDELLKVKKEYANVLLELKDIKTQMEKQKLDSNNIHVMEIEILKEEFVKLENEKEQLNLLLSESRKELEQEKEIKDRERQEVIRENSEIKLRLSEGESRKDHMGDKEGEKKLFMKQVRSSLENVQGIKDSWEKTKEEIIIHIENLKMENVELGDKLTSVVYNFSTKLADGNTELLAEMNLMNEALRERGETISKLEDTNARLRNESSESEIQLKELIEKLDASQLEASSVLEQRDKTIRQLTEEIEKLQISVMTDGKENLERKELLDMQIDEEKGKWDAERREFETKLNSLQTQVASLQSLETDYKTLKSKFDNQEAAAAELKSSLNKALEECAKQKQVAEELTNERTMFKQEKSTFEMIKKELSANIQSLKKAVEKEQAKTKERSLECEMWEQKFKAVERKLEAEKEKDKAMVVNLEEEKQKQKSQSLLILEMAAYERSVNDMKKKLDLKEAQLSDLMNSLKTQQEISETQQITIKELEKRVQKEQASTDATHSRFNALLSELTSLKVELSNKTSQIKEIERVAEDRAMQLEANKLETSQTAAQVARLEEKCQTIQLNADSQVSAMEEKLSQLQLTLERKSLELEELRKEFDSYKVRAQSVLRQSQKEERPSRQQDIEEEVIQLRASCDSMRNKLEEAAKCQQQLAEELAIAKDQKLQLSKEAKRLEENVLQLTEANNQLVIAETRARELSEEAARLLPVQQETLAQCYKKEIEELGLKYKAEVEDLKSALHQAEMALQVHIGRQLPSDISSSDALSSGHRRQPSTGFVPVKTEREMLDVLMLEREACEGSESVDSASPRILPLEQLLAPRSASINVDHSQLIEKLEKSENRIQHLTSLLSDAEGDAARLQQLNQVLKEEIRRKERNVAREEHANNLEYLKNIVVKFATLPRGDERLRLVPVLNTILKLSREEEQRLSAAARGEIGNSGLSSYLTGMWSSPQ